MNKAYLFAILSVLCWSSVSTAFKLSLGFLTPLGLLFISSFTAFIFLLIVNIYIGFKTKQFRNIWNTHNLQKSLISGLLNPFLYYLVLFEAYDRLRAQEAQVLNYTWAIVLSLFAAIAYKEKLRSRDFIALIISFLGVLWIATKGDLLSLNFEDPLGTALAAGSSILWALYWLNNMRDKRSLPLKMMYNFLVGTLLISLYLFVVMSITKACPLFTTNQSNMHWGVLGAVYVGIFEMGLTFLLWNTAMMHTKNTSTIANLIFVTPFISLLFIALILGESIHYSTWIGLLLIITGNVVQKLKKVGNQ